METINQHTLYSSTATDPVNMIVVLLWLIVASHLFSTALVQCISLRADEIKLWLTPSAKQRRNPCSGPPAVYPDLSTRHDWPVKKGFVLFVVIANQVEGEFETHFR